MPTFLKMVGTLRFAHPTARLAARNDGRGFADERRYSPSFFLRWPSVRSRKTRAVQLLSLSSLGMCEPSPADSRPVFA